MEANKIDTFTTILPDFQRMNNIIYIFLFSSPPPQNKWFVLRNSFSTESFSTTLHSAPYLSRRGAKNNLLFSNTLCHFKCSHSIPWDVTSILTTLFPIQYFALSFSLLFFFLSSFPSFPELVGPHSQLTVLPSPYFPMAQSRAAPFLGFLQRSGTPHNCKYSHTYQSQPGCSHQEEEEKLGQDRQITGQFKRLQC